jgi:uncharacterized cupin superfamily protein
MEVVGVRQAGRRDGFVQARDVGVIVRGRLHVSHTDGSEGEVGPGTAYVVEPGHDAWVVGDEPVVAFEFENAATYARG